MTGTIVRYETTYCDCGELAMVLLDYQWLDYGEVIWDHQWCCPDCAPGAELAVYTLDTTAVVVLPVQYAIDGVVWPPTVGLLSHLTGEGNAA